MRKLTLLLLIIPFAFGACQDKYPDLGSGVYAEFITNKGTFVAKLHNEATPLTVANFVALASGTNDMVDSVYSGKKYFNGLTFHRVMKDFMIQGGDPLGTGNGSPGYRFPDEFIDTLKHDKKGVLSMANLGPETNGSQFFVTLKETPWLDGRHTVFGQVVMGQEIVDAIGSVATTKPGDKPVEDVIMQEVNIINKGKIQVPSFTAEMEALEGKKKEKEGRIAKVAATCKSEFDGLIGQAEELPSGLKVYWNQRGKGIKPDEGTRVRINYAGYFDDGRLFDSNIVDIAKKFEALNQERLAAGQYGPTATDYSRDAQLVAGFKEGLLLMSVGDKLTLFVPSHLGYGAGGYPPVIPPNEDLVFELEIVDILPQN